MAIKIPRKRTSDEREEESDRGAGRGRAGQRADESDREVGVAGPYRNRPFVPTGEDSDGRGIAEAGPGQYRRQRAEEDEEISLEQQKALK